MCIRDRSTGAATVKMATVEQGAYKGPRPLCQEKPLCRFHHSVEMVQPVAGADPNHFDSQVVRSKGAGSCNPSNDEHPVRSPDGYRLGQGQPAQRINPALLPSAGKRVQHNNVVRPGILDKGHSARLDSGTRTWVNHEGYLDAPPPLLPDGAPEPRPAEGGFDTWGWAVENAEDVNEVPSPTRGHEGYGPAPPDADIRWRSSVGMSGVRMLREAHGVVNHMPCALETVSYTHLTLPTKRIV
eukprot:TRINITY_DN19643_c0_g1_i1.p1 TRINITY_DN19643_c0_g1~~TRINITY_DN19643_c0_g1_i1.p1  ORF type:complete len:241 (+),score=13.48 TRINITY_DN19643_c0_g1_i1:99-821(+)